MNAPNEQPRPPPAAPAVDALCRFLDQPVELRDRELWIRGVQTALEDAIATVHPHDPRGTLLLSRLVEAHERASLLAGQRVAPDLAAEVEWLRGDLITCARAMTEGAT